MRNAQNSLVPDTQGSEMTNTCSTAVDTAVLNLVQAYLAKKLVLPVKIQLCTLEFEIMPCMHGPSRGRAESSRDR